MLGSHYDPFEHPAATLYCGDPTTLGLWIKFLQILQDIRDGADVGTDQIITLGLDLGYRVDPSGGKWGHFHGLFLRGDGSV